MREPLEALARQESIGNVEFTGYLSGALLQAKAGTRMLHVPYKGNGPALADLAGGKGLPGKKDQVILVVSPDGRDGVKAAAQLKALGHENVQVVGGGLKAWVAANLPLQRKG